MRRPLLAAAIGCASVVAIVVGAQVIGSSSDPDRANPRATPDGSTIPYVSSDDHVLVDGTALPVAGHVLGVGSTRGGRLVVSESAGEVANTVRLYSQEGEEIATADDVWGIAIADRSSELVSWVEVEHEKGELTGRASGVIFDAESGKVVARTTLATGASIMAVSGSTVFINDGDGSWSWEAGSPPDRLRYVPDDSYIMDATDDSVISFSPGLVATTYDRKTGEQVAAYENTVGATFADDGTTVLGVMPDTGVSVHDPQTESTQDLELPGVIAASWEANGDVIVLALVEGEEQEMVAEICTPSLDSCTDIQAPRSSHDGTLTPALPANGLTQILSTSA